jgi:hypothetical protein
MTVDRVVEQQKEHPMRQSSQTEPVSRGGRSPQALVRATLLVGLSVFAASRAEAQYGYPGVSGASFGYGMGMGMTYDDQQLLKAQIYGLNATQIQLNDALAQQAYWAAFLAREQALRFALANAEEFEASRRRAAADVPQRPMVGSARRRAAKPRVPAVADGAKGGRDRHPIAGPHLAGR